MIDMNNLNDWELFHAMQEAEKQHLSLLSEYRRRGLHEKAFCEFSKSRPTKAHDKQGITPYPAEDAPQEDATQA